MKRFGARTVVLAPAQKLWVSRIKKGFVLCMEIAVIDNGIKKWAGAAGKIKEYHGVDMRREVYGNLGEHGSCVLSIIEKYTKSENLYYIFNIMDKDNRGCCANVERVLEHILTIAQVNIVIMSLTAAGHTVKGVQCLQKLCRLLAERGTIIIAADFNKKKENYAYPASFTEVIGVERGGFMQENAYHYKQSRLQITGDAFPEWIDTGGGRHRLFGGTSKAVPKMIYHVEKALEAGADGIRDVERYLQEHSMEEAENLLPEIEKEKYFRIKEKDKIVYGKILEHLFDSSMVNIKILQEKKDKNFLMAEILNQSSDLDLLLKSLFKQMNIRPDFELLHFCDYRTIYDLAGFIGSQL